jgi:membrane dipeptidase
MIRALLVVLLVMAGVLAGFAFLATPILHRVDDHFNSVVSTSPTRPVSSAAAELHQRLFVADLHTDATLWNRGLLQRSQRGHVDLPRLRAGNVALQVFSFPTAYPLLANYRRTLPAFDVLGVAAFANQWPRSTWRSPVARALYQSQLVYDAAHESRGALVVVTRVGDLTAFAATERASHTVAAILSVEGVHVTSGDIQSLDALFRAGIRVFGLAHMSDNAVAGSAHGWRKYGLTEFGGRAVAHLDSLGAIFDLAHASDATIDDVLAIASRPVLVTHTGVDGTCPGPRNLSDDQIRRIAERGGIIGIGFWKAAVCGEDVTAIVQAMRYVAGVAGVDAVALGSDFDGGVRTPFDASELALVTEGLSEAGFSDDDIARMMGLNVLEFFMRALP